MFNFFTGRAPSEGYYADIKYQSHKYSPVIVSQNVHEIEILGLDSASLYLLNTLARNYIIGVYYYIISVSLLVIRLRPNSNFPFNFKSGAEMKLLCFICESPVTIPYYSSRIKNFCRHPGIRKLLVTLKNISVGVRSNVSIPYFRMTRKERRQYIL